MQRDPRAFLQDVVEAADAIAEAIEGVSLENYLDNRMIRSSVEREFIIIGEAFTNLSRLDPELFACIEHAPRIISFRNKLTHQYAKVDNVLVWGVIQAYLNPLRTACWQLACR
jgi:uncharacterized protein with HEPN domain